MPHHIEIGIDANDVGRLARFWSRALGYAIGDLDPAGTYLDLIPDDSGRPVVYLQRVSEPKTAKNRLHLDLWEVDPDATVERLRLLGATSIGDPQTGSAGGWWQVMADPEGNEFCVCRAS